MGRDKGKESGVSHDRKAIHRIEAGNHVAPSLVSRPFNTGPPPIQDRWWVSKSMRANLISALPTYCLAINPWRLLLLWPQVDRQRSEVMLWVTCNDFRLL